MTTNAAFKIRNVTSGGEWSAFSDRGFDCDHGDELEVMLENQPALDVRTGVFSSVGSSKDAPDLTYSSSGVLATAASTITITVPAASPGMTADSWIVRSQTNGGEAVLVNGRNDWTVNTAERMICVRSGGLRKIIATERDQYSEAGGWADAQNEEIEVFGSGLDSVTSAVSTLTASVSAATSGITSLTTRVSTEESTRASADTSLTTRLSSEESARASADTSLETRLSTEESSRTSADTSLDTRISTEESTRASAVTSLESAAGGSPYGTKIASLSGNVAFAATETKDVHTITPTDGRVTTYRIFWRAVPATNDGTGGGFIQETIVLVRKTGGTATVSTTGTPVQQRISPLASASGSVSASSGDILIRFSTIGGAATLTKCDVYADESI